MNQTAFAVDECMFNRIGQLSNVSGPVVRLKNLEHLICYALNTLAHLLVEFPDEMTDEKRNVFHTLSKRRKVNRENA